MRMTTTHADSRPRPAALKLARELLPPSREETLRRDRSVYQFWDEHDAVLRQAWKEWNDTTAAELPALDDSLVSGDVREAVAAAWENPTEETEARVRDLWTEVAPGVFATQFLDLGRVAALRTWLDAAAGAGIPTRAPYGIVLNRRGAMLDARSVGHLAAPGIQSFYSTLVEQYVRPMSRALYPRDLTEAADDDESFAFSIEYQGARGGDKSIRPHSDASAVTFNINIDAQKTWTGSSLIFYGKDGTHEVEWMPGMAVVHLGKTMHAALPIDTGTRSNWVIWTMGSGKALRAYGQVTMGEDEERTKGVHMTAEQRWKKRKAVERKLNWQDRWTPF